MSAHEFMNMARVRAERAEARAEKAEAALSDLAEARIAYIHERGTVHGLAVAVRRILDHYEAAE